MILKTALGRLHANASWCHGNGPDGQESSLSAGDAFRCRQGI